MIDEDARISLEKITSALNISSGSASSIAYCVITSATAKFARDGSPIIILTTHPKRDRVAYSSALLEIQIQIQITLLSRRKFIYGA